MSRIKSYLLGFISLYTTVTAIGQTPVTRPAECDPAKITASGNTNGAEFSINPFPAGCLTGANSSSGALVTLSNVINPSGQSILSLGGSAKFNFDYKDSDGPITFGTNASVPSYRYTIPGTYWIVMNANVGTTSYLRCKSVEIIKTNKLEIDYDFCDPLNIKIQIKDTPNNREQSKVLIVWGNGDVKTYNITTFPYTIDYQYTSPPTTQPIVQGVYTRNSSDACTSDGVVINMTPAEAPKIISLEGLAGGSQNKITVKGGTPDVEFNIEMRPKGGTWTSTGKTIKVANTSGATAIETITVPNASGEYCFRLQKAGLCNASTTSDPVCTIKSNYQVLSPKDVKVDWTSESYNPSSTASITRYQFHYREYPTNLNQNSVPVTISATPSFTFNQMECSKKYEFWIVGSWGAGASRVEIKSPPFVVDPATGGRLPSALIGIASVGTNAVNINMFSNVSINKYNIYKAEGNSTNFQKLATVNTNTHTDPAVQLDKQQYCYKVDYEDDCGNTSDMSDAFCTIFLTSAQPNTLNWTPFSVSGSPNVLQNVQSTEYTIQVIDASGTVLYTPGNTLTTEEDVQTALDRFLNDPSMNGRVTFRILATQDADLVLPAGNIPFPFFSYSNTYTFTTPAQLYIPSAFTPNDDSINDVFKANGKFISEFNLVIYNRWGAPVFESKNIDEGWDGTENGFPAPQGSYSYKIYGLDHAGQEFNKVGSVLLLK